MGLKIVELVPSAPVATDGTMDFAYPSGLVLSRIDQSNEILSVEGHGSVLEQTADTFTVSYDSDSATVTWKGDTSIPAGTKVSLQINTYDSPRITDSTGGTADSSEPFTLAAVTNPDLSAWNGSVYPTAAQATAIGAAFTAITNALATLAQEVNRINGVVDTNAAEDEA